MTASLVSRMNEVFLNLERAQLLEFQKRALALTVGRLESIQARDRLNAASAEFTFPTTRVFPSSEHEASAYKDAVLTSLKDMGIPNFKERLQNLGNADALETVIEAAQNVALRIPSHIGMFFDTMSLVPDCDLIHYAVLVSNYVGQCPVVHTSDELELKINEFESVSAANLKNANIPNIPVFSSVVEKKLKSSKYLEYFTSQDKLDRTHNISDTIEQYLRESMESKTNQNSVEEFNPDLLNRGVLNAYPGQSARFFSSIKSVYDSLGSNLAALWMRTANELYAKSKLEGNVFVLESIRPLIHYVKELGLDFDQFVEDYMSKDMDGILALSERCKLLPVKRRAEFVRYVAGRREYVRMPHATMTPQLLSRVFKLLPDDASTENLFDAFLRVEKTNSACLSNLIDCGLLEDSIAGIDKASSFDGFVKQLDSKLKLVVDYIEFAREQREKDTDDDRFDDAVAKKTLFFYLYFLGKNFAQFKRDFVATDGEIHSLCDVRNKYLPHFGGNKLKTVLNYVVDKRNKDLIWDLTKNVAPGELLYLLAPRLQGFNSKKVAEALVELNRTHHFLRLSDSVSILFERLKGMPDGLDHEAVMKTISSARRECYPKFFGRDVVVPEQLEGMVDNIVVAYYAQSKRPDVQSALRLMTIAYLRDGPVKSFEAIRNLDPNAEARVALEARGVNVDVFERGIERVYHVKTDGNEVGRIKERIQFEFRQIYELLTKLEFDDKSLSKLKKSNYRSRMDSVEKFVTEHEFDEASKDLKSELKGHVQTVRSLNGSIRSISDKEDDVKFYVSTDLFEALHMGQYFGTCLSLAKHHGGVNSWASVVQVMDSNKNVIYAKDSSGNYVGRTRTVLTTEGILCTWFYQNGHLYLDDAWVDYLCNLGRAVGQDVMIPTNFAVDGIKKRLDLMVKSGSAAVEKRTCFIERAYFNDFFGDGIKVEVIGDELKITEQVYVISSK